MKNEIEYLVQWVVKASLDHDKSRAVFAIHSVIYYGFSCVEVVGWSTEKVASVVNTLIVQKQNFISKLYAV